MLVYTPYIPIPIHDWYTSMNQFVNLGWGYYKLTLTAPVPNSGSTRISSQMIGSFLPLNGWIADFP